MPVITFTNNKGGVAKTATVVMTARRLASRGLRALVVDLDPQANATDTLAENPGARTILDAWSPSRPAALDGLPIIDADGIDLIPAHHAFTVEAIWRKMPDGLPDAGWSGFADALREKFAAAYDVVLVDTPPALDVQTKLGIALADYIVVPVRPASYSTAGYHAVSRTVVAVGEQTGRTPAILGIVIAQLDRRTSIAQVKVEDIRGEFGALVFRTMIRQNVAVDEALTVRQDVARYAPDSAGAEDYEKFTAELLERIAAKETAHAR